MRAQIETLGGFSAHAGQTGLVDWVSHFETNPKVVLVHGEADALDALAKRLWDEHQIEAMIPTQGQSLAF
ncbi:MBL fold metallo-hydrolase RNA specificity domain-containing protein [Halopseudomonas pachastrellae]|nr:MBL fold metallo-hydrolase RNA specificity domain-containing protein [Halopseudomonas pachastrellae]